MLSAASPGLPRAPATRLDPRLVFWLILALSAATLYPVADVLGTIQHLRVRDTDDAMRLVGVRDLVAGQGWYDNVQHRFLPPGGVASHWSRLVDAPLAGSILALTPLLGRPLAEGLTAALWPPLLLALYGVILFLGVRRCLNPRAAALAVLAALQTLGLVGQFTVGRVDHHNLQILAMLGLAFCLVRGGLVPAFLGGALAALSLAIGLEGLPTLALAALFLVGDWIARGWPALAGLTGFGLGLGLGAALLFGLQTAPALWGTTACDALSPPWLWLAVGGMIATLTCAIFDRHLTRWNGRLALAAGLGVALGAGFAALFPICLGGPFPGMPALVHERWLRAVSEMMSVPAFIAKGRPEILAFYPPLVAAALAAAWAVRYGPATQRRYFLVVSLFLWPGLIVGWDQFRGTYIAAGFIPLVAGPAIDRALTLLEATEVTLRRRIGASLLAASLVSTIWSLPAYALAFLRAAEPTPEGLPCQAESSVSPLAALPPGTILAPINMGPAILLHTPHAIVAAPYHRAIPGLIAAIEGLGGSEADLRRQMTARGATYLVTCPTKPVPDLGAETAFATRLTTGAVAVPWLEPVPVAGTGLKVWLMR
ncbi:hypothetical protein [Methylobacterium soli]|uniref:hypothetical protein n=1 Tax=Methylobacterium soli TaxID=553447 RepID=UPI001EE24D3A|nr:hypothetical protein [Methylobacterium soli]GJE42852.1 hypothetical protein AEGHOMDF_2026 [Methylobacterium soli]